MYSSSSGYMSRIEGLTWARVSCQTPSPLFVRWPAVGQQHGLGLAPVGCCVVTTLAHCVPLCALLRTTMPRGHVSRCRPAEGL